jgi:hypothetical protein
LTLGLVISPFSAISRITSSSNGLCGAGFPLVRSMRKVLNFCIQYWLFLFPISSFGVKCFSLFLDTQVIFKDIKQIIWHALSSMTFAVLFHLCEHSA